MNGRDLVRYLDVELKRRGIAKGEFYSAVGITATAYYGWRNGAVPKDDTVDAIEKYLNVNLAEVIKPESDDKSDELREMLRDRQDLRILLHSAKDVPASSVYALISQLEKMKEDEN